MKNIFFLLLAMGFWGTNSNSQTTPAYRTTTWSGAGNTAYNRTYPRLINVVNFGAVGNGIHIDDTAIRRAIDTLNAGGGGIVFFPSGTYLLKRPLTLPKKVTLRGEGSGLTRLRFKLGGAGHCISAAGGETGSWLNITGNVPVGQDYIDVPSHGMSVGNWIRIKQNDSNFITSGWSSGWVGQISQIKNISGNRLYLDKPLRVYLSASQLPKIRKLNTVDSVGVEDLRITRNDSTSSQTSNFNFTYLTNSWIYGVQSDSCNYAHVTLSSCSNITIYGSYFFEGFSYGGGGRAYGIALQYTTGNCLIENNIFRKLRHPMLLQACSNGNVLGYNFSLANLRTEFPTDASSDLVLHGNYNYFNLFEGNIGQTFIADVSHGINGFYNTFFRNRAELYGIFVSSGGGDSQNFVGNEITGTGFGQGNFSLNGVGHFQHNNNRRGTFFASGTTGLNDTSYYLSTKPSWWNITGNWPSMGGANTLNSGTNPAKNRYLNVSLKTVPLSYGTSFPVKWLSFSGEKTGENVVLKWQTAMEVNSKNFEIQRSESGEEFKTIYVKKASGNSNKIETYFFTDINVPDGLLFYRIKQNDFNFSFNFSETVSIIPKFRAKQFSVWPNPCSDIIYVSPGTEESEHARITILNSFGIIFYDDFPKIVNQKIAIPIDFFPRGLYYIKVVTPYEINAEKIFLR